MQTSQTFTDERSGDAAVAAETVTRGGVFIGDSFAGWNSGVLPDSSTLGDPALFATGRSNPDSGLTATVVYAKSPLGLELVDVFVGDFGAAERVYDNEVIFVEHQLGANPQKICTGSNESANHEFCHTASAFDGVEQHLSQKQTIKNERYCSPGEVAFGSEDIFVIHASIIAGSSAVQEGK